MASLLLGTTVGGHAVIHAGNIAAQSVNYANSAGSVAWTNVSGRPTHLSQFTNDLGNYGNWITSAALANYLTTSQVTSSMISGLNNMLGVTTLPYSVDITVNGDPDRFYAVQFWGGDQDVWRRIIIKRGYSEPAPWDPIGTGVHHGGLLLDWEGNFGGWGGAEYADRIRVFNESYTNVCADMFIWSHSMGYVFMLRGGGAVYHLYSDQAINGFYQSGSPDILYSTSTLSYDDAWSGTNQYDVAAPAPLSLAQVNSSRIDGLRTKKQSLLDGRYLRQGVDISGIGTISSTNFLASNAYYLNGTSYYLNSSNGGIYTNARFESGTLIVAPGGNSSQWNTAYGWGNHATAGYIVAGSTVAETASWTGATKFRSSGDISNSGASNHSLQVYADLNNDAYMAFHISSDFAVYFGLENATNRLYTGGWSEGANKYQIWDSRDFSSTNISNWNTAYGWGNHASVGYLTSLPSHNHDGVYVPINPDNDGPSWQYSDENPTINGTYVGGRQSFGADGDALTGGALQARLLNAYDGHVNSAYGYYVGNLNYGGDSGTHSTTQVIDSSGRWVGPSISDSYISSASTWNTAYNWGNHAAVGYLTSLPSHTHDDRYLVKGGGWYGVNLPGSRWGGFAVDGGEIAFGNGLPNANQMGILIDGAYLAGENNGFWSLPSDNNWNGRRGMSWNGTYLDFSTNSPTAQFTNLRLANGFEIQQGGSNYGRFNSWVHLNGHYGLYSDLNGAHFYPNNGSYGSWRMDGSRNSYQGIEFGSGSNGNVSLMINVNSNVTGFHNNSYDWQFYWSNGTFYVAKNAYGGGTLATVLDSSNFTSWAASASHTHDDRYYTESESDGRFLRYRGVNAESDFQRFVDNVGEVRFDQVTDYNQLSNPPGGYNYGGVLSMRGENFGFQIWGSHTGELWFKTQWNDDQYSGWRSIVHSANIGSQSVNYATSAGSANSVAWTNVSGRPTALSQFTNDLVISTTDNTKLPLAGGTMSGRLTLKSISGVEQTVPNDFGAYLHLGAWGVGRTEASAVLVNTAYRADYADSLFDMNISRFTNNSGYITSSGSISGNAATATYATSATRLYASDSPYRYGDSAPYYLYMNYDGGSYWELKVSPATPGAVRVAYANSSGTASQVSINYNNDSNSTYQLLWGSGNSVYGTAQVYVNPSSDVIYARGGYISPGNPWGTADSAYFPNGITTAGGTNWVYGNTYLGNAPSNGSGAEVLSNGRIYVRASSAGSSNGYAGLFIDRNSASSNYVPWSFENEYGNHSWGVVARFYISQASADRPSIQFANATNNTRWGIGYCYADDNFRITKDLGMAPDGSGGGWGTEYFRINTDGTTLLGIQGNNTNVYGLLRLASNNNLYLDNNYGQTIVGAYSSTRYQGIFAMGDSYKLPIDGSGTGSLYGLAWSHPNAGGVAGNLNTHGLLVMENGTFLAAISGSIRARDDVRAPALYDSGSRVAISRGEGRDYVNYSRYVYNNGAYSGSGWVEPSDLGVRYANSAGSASSATSASSASNADRLYPIGAAIDDTHPGYGLKVWYDWAYSGTYRNGITIGSHPSDQAYGWQLWQNMWDDRLYMRRYNGGWQGQRILLDNGSNPYAYDMNQYVRTSDDTTFRNIYLNGWFRNNNSREGLYNQANGNHFYSRGGSEWVVTGNGGNIELQFWSNHESARRGYVYANTSNEIGFLNSGGSWSLRCDNSGNVTATGDVTAYSDARIKTNIKTYENALEKVLQLRGVTYNRTDNDDHSEKIGVIAQEIEKIIPQVVSKQEDGLLTVSYGNIVGVLIEAIKEQQKEIEILKLKLN